MNKLTLTFALIVASFFVSAQSNNFTLHFELSLKLSNEGKDALFQRQILKKRKKDGYHLTQSQIQDIALKTGFNRLHFPSYADGVSTLLISKKKITQEIIYDSFKRTFFSVLNVDSVEIRDLQDRPQIILRTSATFECSSDNVLKQNWYFKFNTWEVEQELQPSLNSDVTFTYNRQDKTFSAKKITAAVVNKTETEPRHILFIFNGS